MSSSKYTVETLNVLGRKEIQSIAKSFGLKANGTTAVLIEQILSKQQDETNAASENSAVEDNSKVSSATLSISVPQVDKEIINKVEKNYDDNNSSHSYTVGTSVEVDMNSNWREASIVKINKRTIKVKLTASGDEKTVNPNAIRLKPILLSSASSSSSAQSGVEVEDEEAEQHFPKNLIKTIKAELECKLIIESARVPLRKSLLLQPPPTSTTAADVTTTAQQQLTSISETSSASTRNVTTAVPREAEEVVHIHPATDAWAMSMESCLQEMTKSKAVFKNHSSSSSTAPSSAADGDALVVSTTTTVATTSVENVKDNCSDEVKMAVVEATEPVAISTTDTEVPVNKRKNSRQKSKEDKSQVAAVGVTFSAPIDEVITSSAAVQLPAVSAKKRKEQDTKNTLLSSAKRVKVNADTTSDSQPSASKSTSSYKKPPDFSKIHARQYNASKSITAGVVERKPTIAMNMAAAFEEAKQNGFTSKLNSTATGGVSSGTAGVNTSSATSIGANVVVAPVVSTTSANSSSYSLSSTTTSSTLANINNHTNAMRAQSASLANQAAVATQMKKAGSALRTIQLSPNKKSTISTTSNSAAAFQNLAAPIPNKSRKMLDVLSGSTTTTISSSSTAAAAASIHAVEGPAVAVFKAKPMPNFKNIHNNMNNMNMNKHIPILPRTVHTPNLTSASSSTLRKPQSANGNGRAGGKENNISSGIKSVNSNHSHNKLVPKGTVLPSSDNKKQQQLQHQRRDTYNNHLKDNKNIVLQLARKQLELGDGTVTSSSSSSSSSSVTAAANNTATTGRTGPFSAAATSAQGEGYDDLMF